VQPARLQKVNHVPWTREEDETIPEMKGFHWEEIHTALPHRAPGAIQVQCSAKLKNYVTLEVLSWESSLID
jgi:hypothetical protein